MSGLTVVDVKIPYYWVDRWGTGYWTPSKKMRASGFAHVNCGKDGTEARRVALNWWQKWLDHKSGKTVAKIVWPDGSVGAAFERFKNTGEWDIKPATTRDDWERGWRYIAPIFGDRIPGKITLEELSLWYRGDTRDDTLKGVLQTAGVREAHRAMKIWRALWQIMAALHVDDVTKENDPSFAIRRINPKGRKDRWSEGEVVRLVKRAIRMRKTGLACILAILWDSQFSPVDARTLVARHRKTVAGRLIFDRSEGRTKTEYKEEAVIGTLCRRTERLVKAYLASEFEGVDIHPEVILFRTAGHVPVSRPGENGVRGGNRGGGRPRPPSAYTKDTLGDDFREVRRAEFGPNETRMMIDMRRSATVEAVAGEVDPGALANKMGNTIDESKDLQRAYLPNNVAMVRMVDEARLRGRRRLRKDD